MLSMKPNGAALVVSVLGLLTAGARLADRQETCLPEQPVTGAEGSKSGARLVTQQDADLQELARTDLYRDPLPEAALARLGTLRLRHDGEVSSVAFSPDGTLVASAGGVGDNVRVWETKTGKELDRFKDKVRAVVVAFSVDGKTLITVRCGNALIQHWEVATGRLLRQTEEKEHFPLRVGTFSPDRALLALAGHGDHCGLWEVSTGKRLLWMEQNRAFISVAVSHDGKTLATGGQDRAVRLWDIATGKEIRRLEVQSNGVFSLRFSPGDKVLACSSVEAHLQLWDLATGKEVLSVPDRGGALAFSPDGTMLAAGSDHTIRVWDVSAGKETRRLEGHQSSTIRDVVFSRDGKLLASASRDHTVGLWDLATGKPLHQFEGHQGAVVSLAFAPDGSSIASGSDEDHALIVWDLPKGLPRYRLAGHDKSVLCVAYSPDGKVLATGDGVQHQTGGEDKEKIRLWDPATGKLLRQFDAHYNGVYSLAFAPDAKTLASAGGDDSARLWDVATGNQVGQTFIDNRRGRVYGATFSPDGKDVAMRDSAGEIRLWHLDTGKSGSLGQYPGMISFLAFSGDGKALVWVVRDRQGGAVWRWEKNSGRKDRLFEMQGDHECCALSPDGKMLATEGRQHTIHLWDMATGKQLFDLRGHTGSISSLTFSPDGRLLASGSWDTTVLLWDLSRGRLAALWSRLAADQEADAAPSMRALVADPRETVPYLKERLQRLAALEKQVRRLVASLDDEQFEAREKTSRELEELGPLTEFALRHVLEGQPPPETRKRVEQVLDGFRKTEASALPPLHKGPKKEDLLPKTLPAEAEKPKGPAAAPEQRAALRAFEVLVQIGSKEARQALEVLAQGESKAWITEQAKASLRRLTK